MRALALVLSSLILTQINAESIKIGYVNIDKIIENSSLYRNANDKLLKEFEPRKNELLMLYDKIHSLKGKINLPNDIIDDLTYHSKIKTIKALENDFNKKSEIWQQELNQSQFNLLSEIELIINNAINNFATSQNYDLILYENGAFVGPKADISEEIIFLIENN
jgi:outer membrane protein